MQTIIVPTDFSATSFNAAQYAVQMAASQKEATIVLFHVYDKLVAGSDGTPLLVDPEDRRQARIMALNNTRDRLGAPANIKIECIAEEGVLVEQLNRLTNRLLADIIVMGMNGSSPLERIMIGSNTLNTVHAVNAPVLIIPPSAKWSGVKNIAFASDFKDVESSTPIGMLKKMLDFFKPNLFVVNVDSEHHVE
ncbi:MAG TPA: universal stress protein, partial [Parasegetibacter sp.]